MNPLRIVRSIAGDLPVLTAELPLQYTGQLTFAVGKRDETPRTAGIAHLVEHLVMSRVGRVRIPHNAMTADDQMGFFAQGDALHVGDFLNRVAEAVRTLTTITDEDIARQRTPIVAELGEGDEGIGAGPLLDRFGTTDLGLLDFGQPAHRTHTRDLVLAFAETWLHAGNAVLSFSGPTPSNLDVQLPRGAAITWEPAHALRETGWVPNPAVPAALSLILDARRPVRNATIITIAELLHDGLRTDAGLIYSVTPHVASIGGDRRHVAYLLDPHERDVEATATETTRLLRRLAADGPEEELLVRVREQYQDMIEDPNWQLQTLHDTGAALLRGLVDEADLDPDDLSTVTREEVRVAVADALPSLLLSLNTWELSESAQREIDLPKAVDASDLAGLSRGALLKHLMRPGTLLLSPRFGTGLRGAQLLVDDVRIGILGPDGLAEVLFDEIVVAGTCEECGHWEIASSRGDGLVIVPRDWRGSSRAVARLEAAIPAGLRFTVSGDVHRSRRSA